MRWDLTQKNKEIKTGFVGLCRQSCARCLDFHLALVLLACAPAPSVTSGPLSDNVPLFGSQKWIIDIAMIPGAQCPVCDCWLLWQEAGWRLSWLDEDKELTGTGATGESVLLVVLVWGRVPQEGTGQVGVGGEEEEADLILNLFWLDVCETEKGIHETSSSPGNRNITSAADRTINCHRRMFTANQKINVMSSGCAHMKQQADHFPRKQRCLNLQLNSLNHRYTQHLPSGLWEGKTPGKTY